MGLSIFLRADNDRDFNFAELYDKNNFNRYGLSRIFCNFMCRQDVSTVEPELDQIGTITGIDISPIYEMEKYGDDESIEFELLAAETEEEKEQIKADIKTEGETLNNNIEIVLNTIGLLIEKLSNSGDLNKMLDDGGRDTIGYEYYFTDFNANKGESYVENNFGQDMRNFKLFLEFAKSKGATTVWFTYG